MLNMSMSPSVDRYLAELALTKTANTHIAARTILTEYLAFAPGLPSNSDTVKGAVLAYLKHCKDRGNSLRTLNTKASRVLTFYRTLGMRLDLSHRDSHKKTPKFTRRRSWIC